MGVLDLVTTIFVDTLVLVDVPSSLHHIPEIILVDVWHVVPVPAGAPTAEADLLVVVVDLPGIVPSYWRHQDTIHDRGSNNKN